MALGQHKRAVGAFPNRRDAEVALRELRDANFPMDRVSVITRDADRRDDIAGADVRSINETRDRSDNKADEGAATGAIAGGALGGVTGLLVGLGTLLLPGIGPIMLAGATATALATTLAGTAIGAAAGSLIGALIGLGIPEDRARVYNDRVNRGDYLVIVEGTDEDIHRAQAILHHHGIEEWGVYDAPGVGREVGGHHHRAVGVFPHRRNAEAALDELRDAGFPMSRVSLVGRDLDRYDRYPGLTARAHYDNAFFGFPEERGRLFHGRFDRGEYLVVVDGTEDEIHRAQAILSRHGIQEWGIVDAPVAGGVLPGTGRGVGRQHRAVGVFPHRHNAEAALRDLRNTGFNMDHVSMVGKDVDRHEPAAGAHVSDRAAGSKADEGAKGGAATGGVLGGLGGLLVGLGALAIPGVGPVIAGGALATALATTVAGGAIGAAAGGITGALVGLGIPEERAKFYNDRVNRGDYLVMVDGSEDEIRAAESILSRHGIQDWGIYDKSDVSAGGTPHDRRDAERAAYVAPTTPGLGRHHHRAVGIFTHRSDAEVALAELRDAGFPMSQVSLVTQNRDWQHPITGLTIRDRFEDARLGFPAERDRLFHDRFNRGEYLVIVDGTQDEIRRAETILNRRGIQEWSLYDPSQVSATRNVIEPDITPGVDTTRRDYGVVGHQPDVTIVDHRDQTL